MVYIYKKCPEIGFSTYSTFCESCVVPILDYASGVWGYKPYSTIDQLQKNKAKKNVSWGSHIYSNIRRRVGYGMVEWRKSEAFENEKWKAGLETYIQ